MSFVRLLADGAQEAVTLIPLLFTLGIAPAQAQLPRTAMAQAVADAAARPGPAVQADPAFEPAQSLLQPVAGTAMPALVAQHMVLELADGEARLRTTSVFRNDTQEPIAARYRLPLAAAVTLRGFDDDRADAEQADDKTARVEADADGQGGTDRIESTDADRPSAAQDGGPVHDCGGDADDAAIADFIEAGEPDPRSEESGVLWLAPGDEITLVSTRPADVFRRDQRRRVVIVLPPAPAGQPTPQFSAEIDVDAPQPIVALGSATHGGDVDGLGGSRARLFIPNGKVYEARFLSVDLELGTVVQDDSRHWGNEDRLPIALR